jgi:LytS/YehU family sensor histidine kinase
MLLAALESLALLIIIAYLLYKIRWRFFKFIFQNDFLIFALVFSLIFIFFVGLSSANYGSLSRYRIPALPLFLSSLFAIYNYSKQQKIL